ncbi:Gas vesicle synthesis protein GvpL/GvpF [Nonomuraea coxensis DSM 45129]|uniref:Gas vesicle synthesis protein GvpL/GvpF n=1 Tax=Nonomuraea coxensis DSM 45129 TaxID=1122611 RepID=A0ABX8TTB1_9ACTN|nr:GvpL/GvpF family gas vesicle protein [Nonomuraea coxensis]QYC38691.1 Gas vesicle synthesis protein GvpL/GvpF [Nonomuraea coxensis DSM 45129]
MGRPTKARGAPEEATRREVALGVYVYGIVPAGTKVPRDERGLGDPAGEVRLVRHGEIGALVSEVNVDQPLGRPGDFLAHERLLDAVSRTAAVLPFRFGSVLTDENAVVEELLAPHHDDFLSALGDLEGCAEYIVKGRYVEGALMSEILAENPEAAGLRDAIRGTSEDATRNERIRLGEIIAASVEAKRDLDTRALLDALAGCYAQAVIREPSHEQDAVNVALLMRTSEQENLERQLGEIAGGWAGRVDVRLLGPLAPYDFVVAQAAEE